MANAKLTALTALAEAPNDADLVYLVDTSDTTDGASGTGKKITAANLKSGLVAGTLVTTVGATGTDTNVPSEQAVREAIAAIPSGGTGDMKADGTVDFTAVVAYNADKTFTTDQDIVSKKYVDDAIVAAGGYTDEQAQDAVGGALTDTATIDFTYTDAAGTIEASVKDASISLAKMANLAQNTIIGRVTASTGVPEALTAANVRTIINVADGATANTKATGAEVDTGTDDAKFVTAKAITDQTVLLKKSGGTMSGNILQGENTALQLDTVLSADEKYCGITEVGTMGYAATAGDLVYLAAADTKWEKAKADAAATSGPVKLGIVTVTTAENSTCEVLLWGKIRSAAFPTFTVGAPVYVSAATAGAVVVAAPTGTTNFVVRIIGYGNTAEDLFFCPDKTYLELA